MHRPQYYIIVLEQQILYSYKYCYTCINELLSLGQYASIPQSAQWHVRVKRMHNFILS